jgi:putative flippase GtrA
MESFDHYLPTQSRHLAISSLLRCIDFASVGITNAAMHNIVSLLPAVPAMVLLANARSIHSELISSWFLSFYSHPVCQLCGSE